MAMEFLPSIEVGSIAQYVMRASEGKKGRNGMRLHQMGCKLGLLAISFLRNLLSRVYPSQYRLTISL